LRFLEVIGDHARFLIGKPEVVQQGGQIMRMLGPPKAAVDAVLEHWRMPTA
jgi:hypothetical protein